MNTPTKIAVVLLVVLSLLQTAGTVVFVHLTENAAGALAAKEQALTVATASATAATAEAQTANSNVSVLQLQFQNQANALQQSILNAQQQLADRDARVAQLQAQLNSSAADLARVTEALKSSEDTKGRLTDGVSELRKSADDLTRRVAELNTANADLTNRLEVTERERRFAQEQNTELQALSARLQRSLGDAGISIAKASGPLAGTKSGAPPINGVVREVRTIASLPYATISVGSADQVVRGMEFKVIDPARGDFLGVLTVETVEPNEATGRLSGPRVSDIKPGLEVRTQL